MGAIFIISLRILTGHKALREQALPKQVGHKHAARQATDHLVLHKMSTYRDVYILKVTQALRQKLAIQISLVVSDLAGTLHGNIAMKECVWQLSKSQYQNSRLNVAG